MKKIIFIVFIFLASCSPQVTPAPEATVTLPPPTVTPIPPPSLTPTLIPASSTPEPPAETGLTPEQIAQIEEANKQFGGILTINEDLSVTYKENSVYNAKMEGLRYDPVERVYVLNYDKAGIETEAGPGFELKVPFAQVVLKYADGNPTGMEDFSAFDWNEELQQWQRERYKDINNHVSETVVAYPQDEARLIKLNNSSTNPDDAEDSIEHRDRLFITYQSGEPIGAYKSFRYKDVVEVRGQSSWGDNGMPVWNEETGEWEKERTSFFAIGELGRDAGYAFMTWEDENSEQMVIIIKGKRLGKPDNWGYYDADHRP